MKSIFTAASSAAKEYGVTLQEGANIAGFEKVIVIYPCQWPGVPSCYQCRPASISLLTAVAQIAKCI
jgi:hypothetical protein